MQKKNITGSHPAKYSEELWNQVRTEYASTEISVRAIAKKYNIPYATVRSRYESEKWTEAKKLSRQLTTQKMAEKVAEDREINTSLAMETMQIILKKLLKSAEATEEGDASRLKQIASTLKDLRDIGAYQVDTENKTEEIKVTFEGGEDYAD